MALWVLLVLTLEMTHKYRGLRLTPKNGPEAYCFEIKKLDNYLGYMSWVEKYIYTEKQNEINDAKDVLWELIAKDANRPEAYLRLWTIYHRENKLSKCLEISEKLFLEGTEFEASEYTYSPPATSLGPSSSSST